MLPTCTAAPLSGTLAAALRVLGAHAGSSAARGLVGVGACKGMPSLLGRLQAVAVRFHGGHGHHHHHHHQFDSILKEAPEKFQGEARKRLRDFAKLPWEVSMTKEEAAKVLGSYLGVSALEPASVLNLDVDQVHGILEATTMKGDTQLEKALFSYADAVTTKFFGEEVYYRGIVEFSNVCKNDCNYCGIRKHMHDVKRYTMPKEEVVEVAKWAFENKLGNIMLQSGELDTPQRNQYIEEVVRAIRYETIRQDLIRRGQDPDNVPEDTAHLGVAVSLSVGELPKETYKRFFDAGARRYLLRIESSNPDLYAMMHPSDMSWEHRVNCLKNLREVGFMVGTGIMVGLPGQTLRDLAGDILFFKEIKANMIGMGPYITEAGTPTSDLWDQVFANVDKNAHMKKMFDLTTRMNALARVTLGNANISATTALQAIDPMGREIALRRGSNVLMPILTPTKYREHYQLYEGKPCITDTAEECRKCLNARISMIGKKVRDSFWGDPPNFTNQASGVEVPRVAGVAPATPSYIPGSNPAAIHRPFSSGSGQEEGGKRGLHTSAAPAMAKEGLAAVMGADQSGGAKAPSASVKGSDVPRVNIGVFGVMNAGKSTLMNRITRQETSIVDSKPGTTADVKVALMELHDIGPAKLFDTAGIDEEGELGAKKRKRTLTTLKECDVAVLVVDVARLKALSSSGPSAVASALQWEVQLVEQARKHDIISLLLFNTKAVAGGEAERLISGARSLLDPQLGSLTMAMDLNDAQSDVPSAVAKFLQEGVARSKRRPQAMSLPSSVLRDDAVVFLNIPMDAETPSLRLLRPQALVQEEAIRHWATTIGYRMDLAAARSGDPAAVAKERARFMRALQPVLDHKGPKIMITDSQAVDIVHPWTLDEAGQPLLPFTTFSICMIHRMSGGRLDLFAKGLEAFSKIKPGDRVLISEACNHNRITDVCNDIGMVQIPQKIEKACGKGVVLEHAFGREFPELEDGSLAKYDLAIHCGGCMIDHQKMRARIGDLEDAGVPVTNYGLFLSYVHSPKALTRAMEPWGMASDQAGPK